MYDNSIFICATPNILHEYAAQHRVFVTRARFDKEQAEQAMGKNVLTAWEENNDEYIKVFGGYIITVKPNDFTEAAFIAAQRGFGEIVDGRLEQSNLSEPVAESEAQDDFFEQKCAAYDLAVVNELRQVLQAGTPTETNPGFLSKAQAEELSKKLVARLKAL